MINLGNGFYKITVGRACFIEGSGRGMEQFIGQLDGEAFEDFFWGRAFCQLFHCIF